MDFYNKLLGLIQFEHFPWKVKKLLDFSRCKKFPNLSLFSLTVVTLILWVKEYRTRKQPLLLYTQEHTPGSWTEESRAAVVRTPLQCWSWVPGVLEESAPHSLPWTRCQNTVYPCQTSLAAWMVALSTTKHTLFRSFSWIGQ